MNALADHFRQTQLISTRFISLPFGSCGNAPESSAAIGSFVVLNERRHPPATTTASRQISATTKASQRHQRVHPENAAYLLGMVVSPNRSLQPTPKAKSALGSLRCAPALAELKRWADVKASLFSWGSGAA